jgi:hypothetical protein
MRLATLVTLLAAVAAFTVGVASGAASLWTPATVVRTCAPAATPKVVFPFSWPSIRSGRGAIVWLGGAPHCGRPARAGTTLDVASLHSDDALSVPRSLWSGAGLMGPLETASTTKGQIVAALGDGLDTAAYGETDAGDTLAALQPIGGSPSLIATADGYIGDADIVSTELSGGRQQIVLREQRHYESSFEAPIRFTVGSAPISALSVGMDFRADSIVMWAQSGTVYARWITNGGRVFPTRRLGASGYAPQLAAVLSDNDHAFVLWTDEPAPGAAGTATIYLEHSGVNVTFGTPRKLASFTEPAQQRLTPGSIALVRQTPSEGVLAAWTSVSAAGNYMVSAAGLTSGGPLPAATISQPGTDLRLAALAAGPHDEVVAVLESAPRAARGFDGTHQAILGARSVAGGPGGTSFEPPAQLAAAGYNSAPSIAIDPATDRAVVAWQTISGGLPSVAYAVRAA